MVLENTSTLKILLILFWMKRSLPPLMALHLRTQIRRPSHPLLGWKRGEFRTKDRWEVACPPYLSGRQRNSLKGDWILLFVSAPKIVKPWKVPIFVFILLYALVHMKVASSQSDKADHCQVCIGKRRKIPLTQYKVDLYIPLSFQQEWDRC